MDCVFIDFNGNSDKEIVANLADKMYEKKLVKDSFKNAVLEREEVFPTGLQVQDYGIAIPHADSVHVNEPSIAVAKLNHPVKFGKMGGEDGETVNVNIVIMMSILNDKDQLPTIMKILDIFADETKIKKIKGSTTKTELHSFFVENLQM
jgi:PTS system galactitol-specific IIA component